MQRKYKITQASIDRYGEINGDKDIIHYDDAYAKARGFRGALAHGMMVMGYAGELAAKKYGRDWWTRGEFEIKWVAPVCPGDELSVELDEGLDEGRINATVQSGDVAVGSAKLTGSRR